ncbi:sigma 54-interacting transcriptional regulator [Polyangium spumosum]|uniref:FHA domain-containing protein n=1 Tax=Polyangium spumosum TaxID=889282 RepID=A0A6N7PZZ4_9BACT|nr:sigma 54-interacting transcriptional regulator [Polyangium spumosum]MRG95614.1 FHA domain-containing protein [Polyangium spumosum]
MPHLVVRKPGQMAYSMPLPDVLRIGRHEQNELILDDNQVSRQHATITRFERGFEVRDLGSRHGTRVNGEPVTTRVVEAGDRIQIGNVLLELHEEDERTIVHHQVTAAGPPPREAGADRRLSLLFDVSRAIGAMGDTEVMLGEMLSAIVDVLGGERALVGLGDASRGLVRRFCRARRGSSPDVVLSRAVLEATLGRREAVIVRDAQRDARLETMHRERILSAMAVPLGLSARPVGLLYVDDRQAAERFGPDDLAYLTALGHLVSAALESAERYQAAEARAEALAGVTDEILGKSEVMTRLRAQITKYAAAGHVSVLVRGESGSGKELVARALHEASPRAARPFVPLNCAAIPETMLESELFGHEKGAFTGAVAKKRGKFALADGGTLFLDEIGDLALPAQAKLLRALQEGEIQPLGAERTQKVDVRVLCATHKDLRHEIAEKRFREDLYYRLAVVEIEVPPLREREKDVLLIAMALSRRSASTMGKRIEGFTEAAQAALLGHDWPGNVRELRNEVERAVIHADGPLVDAHDLSPRLGAARPRPGQPRGKSLAESFAELEPTEKNLVEEAMSRAKGNVSEAARLLGITRIMMKRRVDRLMGGAGKDED